MPMAVFMFITNHINHEEKEETAGVDRRDHVLYVGRVGQPYHLDRHDHADP